MSGPKISVLTPSFNSSSYVAQAIESVLAQGFSNFEHVVIDGGSTDGIIGILQSYPHLRWISEPDQGQSDAMNKAFDMSTGDIIVYLNADDWFAPGIFEKVADVMVEESDVDIVGGDLIFHDQKSGSETRNRSEFRYPHVVLHCRYGFPYNPLCYFYRRNVQQAIGPFPVDDHYTMDYWFIIRALGEFKCQKLSDVFGYYRHTGGNKSSRSPGSGLAKVAQGYLSEKTWRLRARYWVGLYFTSVKDGLRRLYKYLFISQR